MTKAKSKSKKAHKTKGAKPLPCGGEPADPGYQLQQWQLAEDRFERSCQNVYDELQILAAQSDVRDQLYSLADKGFKEAQKRKEGQRWPLFEHEADPSNDLPQAACILMMLYDHSQELRGDADYNRALITTKMRVEHGAVISELRDEVSYYISQGYKEETNLFEICMLDLKEYMKLPVDQTETNSENKKQSIKIATDKKQGPTPAEKRAWKSYTWVCKNFPELVPNESIKHYTEKMYQKALEESGEFLNDDGKCLAKPSFESWKRNVRGYLRKPNYQATNDTQVIQRPGRDQIEGLGKISSNYEPCAD